MAKKKDTKGKPASKGKGKVSEETVVKPPSPLAVLFVKLFPTYAKFVPGAGAATASAAASRTSKVKPVLPRVNLLPSALADEAARRRLIRIQILIGIAILAVSGAAWSSQFQAVSSAQDALAAAEGKVAEAQNQANTLAPIGEYFTQLQSRLDIAAQLNASQVDYDRIIAEIRASMPPGSVLDSLAITTAMPGENPSGNPDNGPISCGASSDPFTVDGRVSLGCVQFSGTVPNRNDITVMLQYLERSKILASPFITQGGTGSTEGVQKVPFSGTINITDGAAVAVVSSTIEEQFPTEEAVAQ